MDMRVREAAGEHCPARTERETQSLTCKRAMIRVFGGCEKHDSGRQNWRDQVFKTICPQQCCGNSAPEFMIRTKRKPRGACDFLRIFDRWSYRLSNMISHTITHEFGSTSMEALIPTSGSHVVSDAKQNLLDIRRSHRMFPAASMRVSSDASPKLDRVAHTTDGHWRTMRRCPSLAPQMHWRQAMRVGKIPLGLAVQMFCEAAETAGQWQPTYCWEVARNQEMLKHIVMVATWEASAVSKPLERCRRKPRELEPQQQIFNSARFSEPLRVDRVVHWAIQRSVSGAATRKYGTPLQRARRAAIRVSARVHASRYLAEREHRFSLQPLLLAACCAELSALVRAHVVQSRRPRSNTLR